MNALRRFYDRWIMHPAATDIALDIWEHPERWTTDDNGCVLRREGLPFKAVGVWIANGWFFCEMYAYSDPPTKLGLLGRTIVWIAVRPRVADIKRQRKLEAAKRLAESKREWLKALRGDK